MTLALMLLTAYVAVLLLLYLAQRSFMYHPVRGSEQSFLALANAAKLSPWHDSTGELIGWKRIGPGSSSKRMLLLHGNGGSAETRTYLMDGFEKAGEWDFYLLEYPGYGWRKGVPSEQAILDAAGEALTELRRDSVAPLFVTGESLGTGVACLLAGENPETIQGLFLVTPYTSTADIAAGRFPFFPVRLLMQDRYEASMALRKYSGPVALLLAGRDYIVPARYGQALFDGYKGPKKIWIQPDAGHNSLDFSPEANWWREVADFLADGVKHPRA